MKDKNYIVILTSATAVLVINDKHAFIIPPFVARHWKNRRLKTQHGVAGLAALSRDNRDCGMFSGSIDCRVGFICNGDTITWLDNVDNGSVLAVQCADYNPDDDTYALGREDIDINFGSYIENSRRCVVKDVRELDACIVCNRATRVVQIKKFN